MVNKLVAIFIFLCVFVVPVAAEGPVPVQYETHWPENAQWRCSAPVCTYQVLPSTYEDSAQSKLVLYGHRVQASTNIYTGYSHPPQNNLATWRYLRETDNGYYQPQWRWDSWGYGYYTQPPDWLDEFKAVDYCLGHGYYPNGFEYLGQ